MKEENADNNIEQFDINFDDSTPTTAMDNVQTNEVVQSTETQVETNAVMESPSISSEEPKLNDNDSEQSLIISTDDKNMKRRKISTTLMVILGTLIVVATAIVIFKFLSGDAVKIFSSALDLAYSKVSGTLKTREKYTIKYNGGQPIKMSGEVKLNSNIPGFDEYTKYTYGYNLGIDLTHEKIELGISLSEDNSKILDGILYVINDVTYLKSEQLYDKIIFSKSEEANGEGNTLEIDTNGMNFENIYSDLDVLLKKFTEYIKDSFSSDDFTKEKSTIKIDGKDVSATRINYEIDKDEAFELYKTIVDNLKSDDEALDILANISGEEKEVIATNLESIDLNTNPFEEMKTLSFSIYTKGFLNDVVGLVISEDSVELLTLVKKDEKSELNIKYDNIAISAVTQNGTTTGDVSQGGMEVLTFKVSESEEDSILKNNLEFNYAAESMVVNLKFSTSITLESEFKENATVEFEVGITSEGETITVGGNIDSSIETVSKVADIDVSGAVDAETLSEDEQKRIYDNLLKALEDTPFNSLLGLDILVKEEYVTEGNALVSSAELYAYEHMSGITEKCVSIDELVSLGYSNIDVAKYDGRVVITNANGEYSYVIYLTDNSYMINGVEVNDYSFGIMDMDVEKYTIGQINLECSVN